MKGATCQFTFKELAKHHVPAKKTPQVYAAACLQPVFSDQNSVSGNLFLGTQRNCIVEVAISFWHDCIEIQFYGLYRFQITDFRTPISECHDESGVMIRIMLGCLVLSAIIILLL